MGVFLACLFTVFEQNACLTESTTELPNRSFDVTLTWTLNTIISMNVRWNLAM